MSPGPLGRPAGAPLSLHHPGSKAFYSISVMTLPSTECLDLQAALAGEFSLQRELGRGGMGVVYLARDVQLDRDVAIKMLPAELARTPAARERFLREARMAAGLSHPHIVPIHRVSEAGGFVFFVMSYVEGETLGQRLRTRGAARGRALVTDFGIAQGGGADAVAVTEPGKIMGTAHFMSPEQAAGESLDGRSDIYALGVVGYLAVSGRLPFEASNVPALLVRHATEEPASGTRVAPGLPPALGAAIDKCLARDPDSRFADGEALAAALAPSTDARPALPPALRAWLAARNPLLVPYMGWSAGLSILTAGNIFAMVTEGVGRHGGDVARLMSATAAPLLPIVGFHLDP